MIMQEIVVLDDLDVAFRRRVRNIIDERRKVSANDSARLRSIFRELDVFRTFAGTDTRQTFVANYAEAIVTGWKIYWEEWMGEDNFPVVE